jgi:phage gp36-like protein
MVNYTTFDKLKGEIPETFLISSLDDDGDGVVDAFDVVLQNVQTAIDGILCVKYNVPFEQVPMVVQSAALVLMCEACFRRREVPDEKNPHFKQAESMRRLLMSIAKGDVQLQVSAPTIEPIAPSASIIVEESRLGHSGRTLG